MPRKGPAPKRPLVADPVYQSPLVTQLVNKVLVDGKLDSYYEQVVLLDQKFIRDDKLKVSQIIADATAKMGENITISRFARFKVGEAAE